MSAKSGPSIVTSNLILHYDLDNEDSYLGEPTVNLLASWMNSLSSSLGTWGGEGGTGSAAIVADPLVGFKVRLTKTNSDGRYAINNGCATSATVKKTHSCLIRKISAAPGALLIFYTDYYTPTRYAVGVYVNLDNMTISSENTVENASITNVFRDWYLVKYTTTFTDCESGSHHIWLDKTSEVELAKYQLENKDHYTTYVNGTRSYTNVIKDLSGNNYHASLYSAAQFQNQRPFYPYSESNGAIAPKIDTAAISDLNLGTGEISVEIWFKQLSGSVSPYCGLFTHGAGGGWPGYGMFLNTTGLMYAEVYGETGGRQQFHLNASATLNQYNQVVYVFSIPDLKVYGYKNGVFTGEASLAATGSVSSPYEAHLATLHWNYFWGLNGFINIFRVYKRKLLAAEVTNNYNATKSRFGL